MSSGSVMHQTEAVTAAFGLGSTALAMAAAQAITAPWEPVTPMEVGLGAVGGLLGGMAYASARRMRAPMTVFVSLFLAAAWCALLAPTATHVVAMLYPMWRAAVFDAVVTLGIAGVLGACGMTLYEGLLAFFDALKKALPDCIDDVLDWIFRRPKK